jgi:hypothetical protein
LDFLDCKPGARIYDVDIIVNIYFVGINRAKSAKLIHVFDE